METLYASQCGWSRTVGYDKAKGVGRDLKTMVKHWNLILKVIGVAGVGVGEGLLNLENSLKHVFKRSL